MLILPIKKKWFDMIKSGEKKEEYRELKEYYFSRFGKLGIGDNKIHEILFRNGYGKDKPTIKCKVKIYMDYGNTKWGAEIGQTYFVLRILDVEEIC